MSEEKVKEIIIKNYGTDLYQKAKDFPKNQINILLFKKFPLKIRSLILDNEREFHLIVDEKKGEIFHDCPSFLIYSELTKKICVHFLKLLLILNEATALRILENIEEYNLTHEDYGSRKKSKNYLLLANRCITDNNVIEGLSFLNKSIINQKKCKNIIRRYLTISINNNLFLEFFNFIKTGFENELNDYFKIYNTVIEEGFKRFLKSISSYSFFDLLNILNSLDVIFRFDFSRLMNKEYDKIKQMLVSSSFNEKYFSLYLIKAHQDNLIQINPNFDEIISLEQINSFKEEILEYFFDQIDNFCIIDTLKLIKNQFEIFEIPKERFQNDYSKYKAELKELERKLYLKKFAFLKILIEKHDIAKTKANFRKKRNTYVITHNPLNMEKSVYYYILSRMGFFGIKEQTIKSSEIGINYYIFKELFLDDLDSYSDVMYYKNQFWGEGNDYEINLMDGYSLISKNINYDISHDYAIQKDTILIEWDLANKPIQGSIFQAYGNQIIIPDINNPLFYDIKPFDLCFCKKKPVKIEGNIIKSVNIISKCSFEDAIKSIQNDLSFIEGYYPLSLVNDVIKKSLSPFDAFKNVITNPNKDFIPNYGVFVKAFRRFLIKFINDEKEFIFHELKIDSEENIDYLLILMDLKRELEGIKIDFSHILKKISPDEFNLYSFKVMFLKEVHSYIDNLLKERETGMTKIFDLAQLRNTPFSKYFDQILQIRKEEFENAKIFKIDDDYDIIQISRTYYGQKIIDLLISNFSGQKINEKTLIKLIAMASKLNLKPKIVSNRDDKVQTNF